jgi:hypothetical protein
MFIDLFIHHVACLTTGRLPLTKRILHRVRTRASSLKLRCRLFSLRSSSSGLHLLPCRLPPFFLSNVFENVDVTSPFGLMTFEEMQDAPFFLACVSLFVCRDHCVYKTGTRIHIQLRKYVSCCTEFFVTYISNVHRDSPLFQGI